MKFSSVEKRCLGAILFVNISLATVTSSMVTAVSPILCPEHISKTMLATVMKFHGWIDLIKAECSAHEP